MRKLRIPLLNRRALALAVTPAIVLSIIAFAVALYFVKPAPPKHIVMASAQGEGRYKYYARLYQQFLARNGVTLELRPTSGAVQSLTLLMAADSGVDVAFIQGGTGYGANAPDLVALGSLYYEPLWVFYRGKPIADLDGLRGRRIAIGSEESGTRTLALQLLAMNDAVLPPTSLLPLGGKQALEQLTQGKIDAVMTVTTADSKLVERLLAVPGINLLSFERAEAYTRLFPYLTKLVLPRGVFDLARNTPPHDVVLISPTANLIARTTLHPALAYLLVRAATEINGPANTLNREGEFPAPRNTGFPLSEVAVRYYQSGTPFLQRYLPFWAANLVDRLWVVLVPVIAVLVPLIKLVPPAYRWKVRSRIYRWYARLKELELQLDDDPGRVQLEEMLQRLENIERSVNRIPVPLAYSENLYSFRTHIDLVRNRVIAKLGKRNMSKLDVVGLCGSLRAGSWNRMVLEFAGTVMPEGMALDIAEIRPIPPFDADVLAQGFPAPVAALRERIRKADGVLIVTPEYNFSIPGMLKNALDWASRGDDQPFMMKAVVIASASPGPLGGARVQYDLRKVLLFMNAMVLAKPEVFVGAVNTKFDANRQCTDENTRKFLTDQMRSFERWIQGVRRLAGP